VISTSSRRHSPDDGDGDDDDNSNDYGHKNDDDDVYFNRLHTYHPLTFYSDFT
jgi:hypothetical protein